MSGGLEPGGLFEWAADIGGVHVGLLAEVEVAGTSVHLRDVAVYPGRAGQAVVGVAPLLRVLRREIIPHVRTAGFTELRISGIRLTGSRPGRTLDITISLTKDST